MNCIQILPIVYVAPSIWNVALLHFLNSFPATACRLGTLTAPLELEPAESVVRPASPLVDSCSDGVPEDDDGGDGDGFSITILSSR
jgi:hypothetical protein